MSVVGRFENLGGGHCVMKWGFTRTFSGHQDATLKYMSELTFIGFCWFLKYLINPESKECLEKAKTTKSW